MTRTESGRLPEWDAVQAQSAAAALAATPAELHGGLAGWLAGGGEPVAGWTARVLADAGLPAPEPGSPLDALREATSAHLADPALGFALLLPEAATAERANALFDWCRGFLGGFGLAAGAQPPLSEEGSEALADLANLARADVDEGDDDEDALAEIEEFVRVAVLLLHGDCVLGPRHRRSLN